MMSVRTNIVGIGAQLYVIQKILYVFTFYLHVIEYRFRHNIVSKHKTHGSKIFNM